MGNREWASADDRALGRGWLRTLVPEDDGSIAIEGELGPRPERFACERIDRVVWPAVESEHNVSRTGRMLDDAGLADDRPTAGEVDVDRDAALGHRVVSELAVFVGAPALDPAASRQRTGVVVARGDRADAAREARDVDGDVAVAPALDSAAARQRAGVPGARGNRADATREARNVDRAAAVGRRAAAKLPIMAGPPALSPPAAREGASVVGARGDCADAAREARDLDRPGAVGRRAVPELAVLVGAP